MKIRSGRGDVARPSNKETPLTTPLTTNRPIQVLGRKGVFPGAPLGSAKAVGRARTVAFQMAEVAISKNLFAEILRMIVSVPSRPGPEEPRDPRIESGRGIFNNAPVGGNDTAPPAAVSSASTTPLGSPSVQTASTPSTARRGTYWPIIATGRSSNLTSLKAPSSGLAKNSLRSSWARSRSMNKIASWAAVIALVFPEALRPAQLAAMGWPRKSLPNSPRSGRMRKSASA